MRNFWLVLLCLFLGGTCRAGVQVVANGSGAPMVTPHSMDLRVRVAGGFASTTAQWTFSNSQQRAFEAEFLAEAPADAVVTGFAYWFKGKKVIARIVEKARAARIYRGVTERRRDPALVEMMARNYFRVRISPVEAKKDLRVEVTWVQPLNLKRDALIYSCPLWRDGENVILQKWSIAAQVQSAPGVDAINNNFSAQSSGALPHISLSASGAKVPPQNIEIRQLLPQRPAPLGTVSSSGGAPYFAVLSAAARKVEGNDSFSVPLYDGGFLLVGRGALPTGVNRADLPAVAEKLWAAAKLDDLGKSDANRAAGMKLSVRYGLPSQWTNWLAIPDEERARLREIIEEEKLARARANVEQLGRAMALEVAAGREKRPGFALMKQQFAENCRLLRVNPQVALFDYYSRQLADTSAALSYRTGEYEDDTAQNLAKARSLHLQISRLARLVPRRRRPDWTLEAEANAARHLALAQVSFSTEKLEKSLRAGRPDTAARRVVENGAPASLGRETRVNAYDLSAKRLAKTWAKERAKAKPNAALVRALRTQIKRINSRRNRLVSKRERSDEKWILAEAEGDVFNSRIYEMKNALDTEIVAHRENGPRAGELRAKLNAVAANLVQPLESLKGQSGTMQQHMVKTIGALRSEQAAMQPDAAKIAALNDELDRLKKYISPPEYAFNLRHGEDDYKREAPRKFAQQWLQARHGAQPDAEAAAFYRKQIQKLFDDEYAENKKRNPTFPYTHRHAVTMLAETEASWLSQQSEKLLSSIIEEQSALHPDQNKIAAAQARLQALEAKTDYNTQRTAQWLEGRQPQVFESVLNHLREVRKQANPDAKLVADLETRVIALQPYDAYFYHSWGGWSGGRKPNDPKEYGKLRVERIAVRAQREQSTGRLKQTPNDDALRRQIVELERRENELTVRMGDPLIAVTAPRNCRQVIALLPSGEIKPLFFNAHNKRWEARFDVPTYTREGTYKIMVIVVAANGTRQRLSMTFHVDLTAPRGAGTVKKQGSALQLSLETAPGTDRVEALLPWGARLDLKRAGTTFFASAPLPDGWNRASKVTFVLTDAAHNRTHVEVDFAP